jgi:hypothetical protein
MQPDRRHWERAILSPCGHVPLVRSTVAPAQPRNVRSPLLVDA